MPLYVADLLLDNLWILEKEASERMRMMCWMTAQVNSKKRLNPEDIIKFAWEKKSDPPSNINTMSQQQWQAMQEKAQQLRKLKMSHGK